MHHQAAEIVNSLTSTEYTHDISSLLRGTTYYWKLIGTDGTNSYVSDIYSFTTGAEIIQEGHVTVSRGGGPVSDATIELSTITDTLVSTITTTTDAKGYFSISIQKGAWKIRAKKSGRASSEATITIEDDTIPNLSLVQFPVEYPSWSFTPPIMSVAGVSAYQSFTGDETSVVVTATAQAIIH